MKNFKSSYSQGEAWLNNTGSGLREDEKFDNIEDYMATKYPFHDILSSILAEKKSISNATAIETSETEDFSRYMTWPTTNNSTESMNVEALDESFDFPEGTNDEIGIQLENTDEPENPFALRATPSQKRKRINDLNTSFSDTESQPNKKKATGIEVKATPGPSKKIVKSKPSTSVVDVLATSQRERLEYEKMRFLHEMEFKKVQLDLQRQELELQRMKMEKELELKQMEFDQNLKLRQMELQKDERLEKAKMELEFKVKSSEEQI